MSLTVSKTKNNIKRKDYINTYEREREGGRGREISIPFLG